jgi:hypothetical protein
MDWSTPDDLTAQVTRLWERGRLLVGVTDGGAAFPLELRLRRPDSRAMAERFDEVRRWVRALDDRSKARRGFGYEIEWADIAHRQVGRQRVPTGAVVPTREDALRLVRKQASAERFAHIEARSISAHPELRPWLARRPLVALEHADDWDRILAVVAWFKGHPRSGLYMRQVDVEGVDTKFIEARRGLFVELLDLALSSDGVSFAARDFEERYGLSSKPARVRFRVLDRRLCIRGMRDIETPAAEFASLDLPVRRVFITENEIDGLAFPEVQDAIVVFGLGYGLERLADVPWLRDKEVHYWGDIDSHGFAMLDRLRAHLADARSFLMDEETLLRHRALWGREPSQSSAPLTRLTPGERGLYEALVTNRHGEQVRLEQERIAFRWLLRSLEDLRDP